MEADTIRVDYTFEPGQVDALWKQAKGLSKTGRLSRGDALAGYLVHVLRSTLRDPPRFVKQMLGVSSPHQHRATSRSVPQFSHNFGSLVSGSDPIN